LQQSYPGISDEIELFKDLYPQEIIDYFSEGYEKKIIQNFIKQENDYK